MIQRSKLKSIAKDSNRVKIKSEGKSQSTTRARACNRMDECKPFLSEVVKRRTLSGETMIDPTSIYSLFTASLQFLVSCLYIDDVSTFNFQIVVSAYFPEFSPLRFSSRISTYSVYPWWSPISDVETLLRRWSQQRRQDIRRMRSLWSV